MAMREPARETRTFIGRERELHQLDALLTAGQRLISLVAPGGYGKTRLAGVWLENLQVHNGVACYEVRLAPLGEYQRIPQATAAALGLEPHEHDDPWQQVIDFCNTHTAMVLLLDNFEHLTEGRILVQDLLDHTTHLTVLVTSREPLGLQMEHVQLLHALPVSAAEHVALEPGLAPAVELFADRTSLAVPFFAVTAENLEQITELCRILDGVPLAIELAAAWADKFSLAELQRELHHHIDLQARNTDIPERHRSVRASCNWSYSLLDGSQQMTVRCLAAFHGGFTLEAARAVLPSIDLQEVVGCLASKSWLTGSAAAEQARFHFCNEAIREYAFQQLLASDDFDVVVEAHCRYFADLLARQARRLDSADQAAALALLDAERDNLNLAIETAFYRNLPELQLTLARDMQEYLLKISAAQPCVQHYERILEQASGEEHRVLARLANLALARAWAMLGDYDRARGYCMAVLESTADRTARITTQVENTLGELDRLTGDHTEARYHFNLARESAQTAGDKPGMTRALFGLAKVSETESRFNEANRLLDECLVQFRKIQDTQGISMVLNSQGNVAYRQGRYDAAQEIHMAALELRRDVGDRRGIAQTLSNIGNVEFGRQNFSAAWTLYSQSLELRREIGDRFGMAASLNNLGNVEYCQHNYEDAARLHLEGLEIKQRIGDYLGCSYSLNNLGNVAYRQQDWTSAQQRISEAIKIAAKVGSVECTLAPLALSCALLAQHGYYRPAAILAAGVKEQLSRASIALDPMDGGVFAEAESLVAQELGSDDLSNLSTEGSEMPLTGLVELGLNSLAKL